MEKLTKELKLKKLWKMAYDMRMRTLRQRLKVKRHERLESDDIFDSEDSINAWRVILKNNPDQWHYKRFLRRLAIKRGIRVLPGGKNKASANK